MKEEIILPTPTAAQQLTPEDYTQLLQGLVDSNEPAICQPAQCINGYSLMYWQIQVGGTVYFSYF